MSEHNQHQHQAQAVINVPQAAKNYAAKEVKFNFRKNAELGTKRPTVALAINFLTLEGLVEILESGNEKQISLVLETLQVPILEQARAQVDENEAISQDTLDGSKLTWEYISKLEPAARRGGGIPKETWEAFVVDYNEVMPAVTGKTTEQVARASALLGNKFAAVKTNKQVLGFLAQQLDMYFANTAKAEEFVECYEFLKNKAEALLKADDAALLANL